jgi:soluble lytic murein transglycosylase
MGRKRKRARWAVILLTVVAGVCWARWWWQGRVERSQDNVIMQAALRYGVEPALVKAVVWQESRFDPDARGRAREIGLMQLREQAAREWATAENIDNFAHEHCFSPRTNTLAGTFYLARLLKRYAQTDDPLPYALADYNAGRGNVLKWLNGEGSTNSEAFVAQVGFPGTRKYVEAVTARYRYYQPRFKAP